MSHTPGPWEHKGGIGFFAGRKKPVVTIGDDGSCGDPECCGAPSYHVEVTDDDARLIAAAPDYWDAVENLTTDASELDGDNAGYVAVPKHAFDALMAAHKKAEGR